MIFRHLTLQPAGLNANFNFLQTSQSQRADVNFSFCFDFSLNDTWHVFFSVALSHLGGGSTLETSGFVMPFQCTL